jgi:hypothetical protein
VPSRLLHGQRFLSCAIFHGLPAPLSAQPHALPAPLPALVPDVRQLLLLDFALRRASAREPRSRPTGLLLLSHFRRVRGRLGKRFYPLA